jgi:hypothetical protein
MMNERIEKLLAELDIDLYTDEGVMMTGILVRPKDLRQFAELIVRKCCDIADDVCLGDESGQHGDTVNFVVNDIKRYFGVKE